MTCWIALDDVDETNGTVYVLPYDRTGAREVVPHRRDPATNDMVGYFGDDPVCLRSSTPAASSAFRAPCSIAAARTRLIACVASTSLSTPPSRSSTRMATRRGTRLSRCCAPVDPRLSKNKSVGARHPEHAPSNILDSRRDAMPRPGRGFQGGRMT